MNLELPAPRSQDVIQFPLGLLGFEPIKEYLWIQDSGEAPFCWLRAKQDAALRFLIVPAFDVLPDYQPKLSDQDAYFLDLNSPSEALVYGIVTLRQNGPATVNLKGPIVINRFNGRAKQVVLSDGNYPLQYPLPVEANA